MLGLATFSIRFTCCQLTMEKVKKNKHAKKHCMYYGTIKGESLTLMTTKLHSFNSSLISWPLGLGWAHFLGWAWPAGSVCWLPCRDQQSLVEDCTSSDQTSPAVGKSKVRGSTNKNKRIKKKKNKEGEALHKQYLELDVVHRWRGDHTIEGGKAMLIADLLAVQLKLRLSHLPIHIESYHGLKREKGRYTNYISVC